MLADVMTDVVEEDMAAAAVVTDEEEAPTTIVETLEHGVVVADPADGGTPFLLPCETEELAEVLAGGGPFTVTVSIVVVVLEEVTIVVEELSAAELLSPEQPVPRLRRRDIIFP